MKKYVYLSYFLNSETIVYGGNKGVKIEKITDIDSGDTANTKRIILHNHSGTHIDFPNHFISDGKVSSDYNAEFWIFNNPHIIKLSTSENEIIDLNNDILNKVPTETDFLIINTGFNKFRNKKIFWNNNPGFSPQSATALKSRCPNIRVLGMDTISLSSYQNRELGRLSHREFLGLNDVLIVEDMNINHLVETPKKIMCIPLLIENLDGCPVTIIAEL